MEIMVHIGRHKTGSTFLQSVLSHHCDRLLENHGILYPSVARHPTKFYHHPLVHGLVQRGEDLDRRLVDDILEEAVFMGARRVLISTEKLSRRSVDRARIEQLVKAFRGHRMTIIVYLRRQDHFLESVYAERVRRGLVGTPDGILNLDVVLDHEVFLQPWDRVIGRSGLRVRSFDLAVRTGLLEDFLRTVGADPNGFEPPGTVASNRRLPWAVLEVIRRADSVPRLRRALVRRRLVAILSRDGLLRRALDRPRPLSSAQRQELLERFTESNRRVARKYMGRDNLFPV